MSDQTQLARSALKAALRTRQMAEVLRTAPVCVFDLAEKLNVEVRFRPETSMDGMYCKSHRSTILLSALRPPGRRAYSCAHELGHHVFGHGTKVDEYLTTPAKSGKRAPEERLADMFAGHLLMPMSAIREAFKRRAWRPDCASPVEIYMMASYFGVGYETMISHLTWALQLVNKERAAEFLRTSPKDLRRRLLGKATNNQVVAVDKCWVNRTIDVEVGDYILLPRATTVEGRSVQRSHEPYSPAPTLGKVEPLVVLKATNPGISRVENQTNNWGAFVRVSRMNYIGRSIFRHLEDPDDDSE